MLTMISSNPIAYYGILTAGSFTMTFCVVFALADCCIRLCRHRRWARAAGDDHDDPLEGMKGSTPACSAGNEAEDEGGFDEPKIRL